MKTQFVNRSKDKNFNFYLSKWVFALLFISIIFSFFVFIRIQKPHAQIPVNGSITFNGEQRILNLWGTNYEMGYAEGYLLADQIMNLIEKYFIENRLNNSQSLFDTIATDMTTKYYFAPSYQEQLQGLYDGMVASGKDIKLDFKNRQINTTDLKMWNAFLDYVAEGCSSYSVWSTASLTGDTLEGRNFDLAGDKYGYFVNYMLVRTVEPSDVSVPDWESVGWPGYIGAVTGMNEYGIAVTANYGANGVMDDGTGTNMVTHGFLYRGVLEKAGPTTPFVDAFNYLKASDKRTGVIVQVSTPSNGTNESSVVIETDSVNTVMRHHDFDYPQYESIVATNHFIEYNTGVPGGKGSKDRYTTLTNGLVNYYTTGDKKVDTTEAWNLIGTVGKPATKHTIVINPNQKFFMLSFAKVVKTNPIVLTPAYLVPPASYTWGMLFPNHSPSPTSTPTVSPTPIPTPVEMIIDNNGINFSKVGSWTLKKAAASYGGDYYLVSKKLAKQTTATASWALKVPTSGNYKVYAWWPSNSKNTSTAIYTINYNGSTATYVANQTINGRKWNLMGTFYLNALKLDQKVIVSNDFTTGSYVGADAIKLAP